MSQLQRAFRTLGGLLGGLALALALPFTGHAQTNNANAYGAYGGEYQPAGALPGDQTHPALSINASGGFLVWQDNITDGSGLGISAVRLDSTLSPTLGNFRVNANGTNDQENPQVALLKSGGAVFVWQSGKMSFQHIMARCLGSNGLWLTSDIQVNTATNNYQVNPAIAVLTNGNVIVTWGSFGQDNSDGLQGVYGQILSPGGQKVGSEFRINQFTPHNQRTPAVAALANGNFIVAWVSELERSSQAGNVTVSGGFAANSVDIYARLFNSAGTPLGGEFLVNVLTNICANPAIAVGSDGGYMICWSQKDSVEITHSWDVWGRHFNSTGVGGTPALINSQLYGDQYCPKISSLGTDYLAVWTSMGQDGSREGVFGQFLYADGSHDGPEFRVNTTVLNQQIHPTVATDGVGHFLAVWSSYVGGLNSMDLAAQRYISGGAQLSAPSAPIVLAIDSTSLSVTWPPVAGFNVADYELFIDGSTTPVIVTNNLWSYHRYAPLSTHSYQYAYVLTNGLVSPLSALGSGTTWDVSSVNGLPDNWMALYYGSNQNTWPAANTVLAPGVTLAKVFAWGANPNDPSTWLRQWITHTPEGFFLNWNTIPGGIYQVQTSTNMLNWTPVGSVRFAAGTNDSTYLGLSNNGYYRIVRNRY